MGVKEWGRAAPWWLTLPMAGGLVFLFLGERVLVGSGIVRLAFSAVGALVLIGAVVWRFRSWQHATGDGKRVEQLLLLCYSGCVVAVLGFVLSSEAGINLLGMDLEGGVAARFRVIMQILSSLVIAVSILPALGAQWALAAHRHAGTSAIGVESLRVRETAAGALTVALAGAMLLLAGYVTSERDKNLDFSYFKTASPGDGTREVVRNLASPVRVVLFFPDVNEVKDEVLRYFRTLGDAAGNLDIETHDRLIARRLANEHGVTSDGTILLLRDERTERIEISTQIGRARGLLRDFDRAAQERLMRLAREPKVAYLTVGHDEINDQTEELGRDRPTLNPLNTTDVLIEILGLLNYRIRDLGLQQGLGSAVPDDAGIVLVLGPQRAFLEEELYTLDRYAAVGGPLLVALDPTGEFDLGPLEDRLALRYHKVTLADDQQYLRRRGNVSDRQYIITDRFSAHEAVTTLSRSRVGAGILLAGAGYLEGIPTADSDRDIQQTYVIRSLPSTFADLNGNFRFDAANEERHIYNLVAAIEEELPPAAPVADAAADTTQATAPGPRTMRALVYADAQMFSDAVLRSVVLNTALAADGIRWLVGEESLGGMVASEEDVRIVHTNAEDVAWFYSTIIGAPVIVLVGGLVSVLRRRRKGGRGA